MAIEVTINGQRRNVTAAPDTPLLYVLTDELELKGPRFGCGLAQCGSCSVLVDGVETRSCVMPLAAIGNPVGSIKVCAMVGGNSVDVMETKLNVIDK